MQIKIYASDLVKSLIKRDVVKPHSKKYLLMVAEFFVYENNKILLILQKQINFVFLKKTVKYY